MGQEPNYTLKLKLKYDNWIIQLKQTLKWYKEEKSEIPTEQQLARNWNEYWKGTPRERYTEVETKNQSIDNLNKTERNTEMGHQPNVNSN